MRVGDGPLAWGVRSPDLAAVVSGQRAVTYGELRDRVLRVAAGLRAELGDDANRPVALCFEDGVEFLVAFLGVVEAGAIATPLAPGWSEAERKGAFEACPWAFEVAPVTSEHRLGLRDLERAGDIRASIGASGGAATPFYIGFSSGSTGRPKAVVRQNEAWLLSFLAMSIEFGVTARSTVTIPGSLFFSFSLIAALQALYGGATVHIPDRASAVSPLDLFDRPIDTAWLTPSLLMSVAKRANRQARTFPGVRQVVCAGEKLTAEARRAAAIAFPSAAVREYYGASELGFVSVIDDAEAARYPGSVGRPFLGSEVAIISEHGEPLPPGDVGLVCARTDYGFAGYFGDPLGAGRIDHHGWQTVGDLGHFDTDGYLYLAGRSDQMVVIHGENVFPEAVEQFLLALPGVEDAAVVADDADQPSGLVAFVVAECSSKSLLDACAARLPSRAVPRRVELVDELPRTATGKVARDTLRARAAR